MSDYILTSARQRATEVLQKVIRPGDRVIDATAGNGHDTCFLAQCVGREGNVTAFDVQEQALEHTKQMLYANGLLDRVRLVHDGHEKMRKYVHAPVRAVMFNLGWLPGSDKTVRTHWGTTRLAIVDAFSLLLPLGVCTVCVYPGHTEGEEEREGLADFLANLKPQEYNVLRESFINAGQGSPECFIIQKQF